MCNEESVSDSESVPVSSSPHLIISLSSDEFITTKPNSVVSKFSPSTYFVTPLLPPSLVIFFRRKKAMSVNESVDPPYLFNVEDESPRFRVASKSKELEIVGDRRFEISEIPQGFFNKEETMDSDGDDDDEEEDSFVGRRGSLIQPGIDSTITIHMKKEQRYHGKVKPVIDSVREAGVKLL